MTDRSLEQRIQILQDIEDIKRLKHAYFRCIDTANIEELKTLLDEHVETCYVGGSYRFESQDRADFLQRIAAAFNRRTVARHNGHHPEIEILGPAEASGIWYLDDSFWDLERKVLTKGTALYRDRYIKVDGRWRIREQTYERIYETVDPIVEPLRLTSHYLTTHDRCKPPANSPVHGAVVG